MSIRGTKRTSCDVRNLVAIERKADIAVASADFRFGPEAITGAAGKIEQAAGLCDKRPVLAL